LDIEASAVENLINGTYISRPDWVYYLEIAALLYFGVFLWLVIPSVRPRIGALILGLFLLTWIATSGFLFFTKGIWLKILAPMALAMIGLLNDKKVTQAFLSGKDVITIGKYTLLVVSSNGKEATQDIGIATIKV
jgi:CHASE2 domain-containing sensor protein